MFGSAVLEVAIGMAFLFTLMSLAATALREAIEAALKMRARQLERGLSELLRSPSDRNEQGTSEQVDEPPREPSNSIKLMEGEQVDQKPDRQKSSHKSSSFRTKLLAWTSTTAAPDKTLKDIYEHPLVFGLFGGDYDTARTGFRSGLPSYIPTRNLALAVLDIAARDAPNASVTDEPMSLGLLRDRVGTLSAPLQRPVLLAIDEAKGDLDRARLSLEAWFDSGMDRVSGWYKRQTQWILLGIGFAMAGVLNIDSIHAARTLMNQQALRTAIVAQAEATSAQVAAVGTEEGLERLRRENARLTSELEGFDEMIGWGRADPFGPSTIPGWLLTALAISLGAPFWFDVLNKVMVVRSTVKPHEKSPEEGSEDRRGAVPASARLAAPTTIAGQGAATETEPRSDDTLPAGMAAGRDNEWKTGNAKEGVI